MKSSEILPKGGQEEAEAAAAERRRLDEEILAAVAGGGTVLGPHARSPSMPSLLDRRDMTGKARVRYTLDIDRAAAASEAAPSSGRTPALRRCQAFWTAGT